MANRNTLLQRIKSLYQFNFRHLLRYKIAPDREIWIFNEYFPLNKTAFVHNSYFIFHASTAGHTYDLFRFILSDKSPNIVFVSHFVNTDLARLVNLMTAK